MNWLIELWQSGFLGQMAVSVILVGVVSSSALMLLVAWVVARAWYDKLTLVRKEGVTTVAGKYICHPRKNIHEPRYAVPESQHATVKGTGGFELVIELNEIDGHFFVIPVTERFYDMVEVGSPVLVVYDTKKKKGRHGVFVNMKLADA